MQTVKKLTYYSVDNVKKITYEYSNGRVTLTMTHNVKQYFRYQISTASVKLQPC